MKKVKLVLAIIILTSIVTLFFILLIINYLDSLIGLSIGAVFLVIILLAIWSCTIIAKFLNKNKKDQL